MTILAAATTPSVSEGVGTIMSIVTTVLTTIKGEPVLFACFCMALIPAAIGIIRALRH